MVRWRARRAKAEADRKRQENAAAEAEAERVNQLESLGLGPSQEQGLEQADDSVEARLDRLIARARQEPGSFGWVDGRGPESWGPVLPGAWP
eukprot:3863522-Alexandrium_andersonii.AAC.1